MVNVVTLSQVSLKSSFIFEYFFTEVTLYWGRGSMLILLVPVQCVFVDHLETNITLNLVGV